MIKVKNKNLRYLWYMIRHKAFVLRAGIYLGAPLWRLLIHDWSKFTPREWVPYAEHFYGKDRNQPHRKGSENFVKAWLFHIHRNPHHWNHWVVVGNSGKMKPLEIPDHFVVEMVSDWMGAGRGIEKPPTWNPNGWWSKNKDQVILHENTRKRVLELLEKAAKFPGR